MITDDELKEAKNSNHQVDKNLYKEIYNKASVELAPKKKFHLKLRFVSSFWIFILIVALTSSLLIQNFKQGNDKDPHGINDQHQDDENPDDNPIEPVSDNNYYEVYIRKILGLDKNDTTHLSKRLVANEKSDVADVEKKQYTVTVDNGYSINSFKVNPGDLVYPDVYPRSGYYFCGWYYNDKKLTRALEVYDDVLLTASWSQYFNIKVDGNTYKYIKDNNGVSIIGGETNSNNLIIPNTIDGINVIGIESGAFLHNKGLVSVKFPDDLEFIGSSAFWKCNFESLYFPKTLQYIGPNAFSQSRDSIKKIAVDEENPYYTVEGNCLIDKETKTIILGCNFSIIPDYIEAIENRAFDGCSKLSNVNLPNTLKYIGIGAFNDCTSIETINIPNGITKITDSVFNNCTNLREIIIPDSVIEIHSYNFKGCISLERFIIDENNQAYSSAGGHLIEKQTKTLLIASNNNIIPDNVEIIGIFSFMNRNIKSIIIPQNVRVIKEGAFDGCTLEEVIFEEGIREIEGYVFLDCINLKNVILPNTLETIGMSVFSGCTSLVEVTFPESITIFPNYMFNRCSSLERVITLGKITSIGEFAFSSCSVLTELDLSNVTYFGSYSLAACNMLEFDASTLSNNIEYIGDMSFFGTLIYGELNLQNIEYLGQNAFRICKNLTGVKISSLLKRIEGDAFSLCYSLENVVLNDGLEFIGGFAFSYTKIYNIIIPSTVTELEYGIFSNCMNLKYLIIPASVEKITIDIASNHTVIYCEAYYILEKWNVDWYNSSRVYLRDDWTYDEFGKPLPK